MRVEGRGWMRVEGRGWVRVLGGGRDWEAKSGGGLGAGLDGVAGVNLECWAGFPAPLDGESTATDEERS